MRHLPRSVRGGLVAASLVTTLACSKPQPPTIAPERVTVTSVDAQSLHVDLSLEATNPNGIDLTVRDVTAHVVVAQKVDLGSMTLTQAYTLPAGKMTPINAPLTVQWGDLNALAQLAAKATTVPFTVDGTVELGGNLLHVTVPYHLAGSLTRQQLLSAALQSIMPGPKLPQ